MIRVLPQPEPNAFDALVRVPGNAFLAGYPANVKVDFKKAPLWRKILDEIHELYGGICAYTCHHIPHDVGSDTVEHFRPKALHRDLAYEWINYRFVCGRLNGRKSNYEDVADPFTLEDGTFLLDFPSLLISPSPGKSANVVALAASTIKRLKLNDKKCTEARLEYVRSYCKRDINRSYLERCAPFLAAELDRLNLTLPKLRRVMNL